MLKDVRSRGKVPSKGRLQRGFREEENVREVIRNENACQRPKGKGPEAGFKESI